MALQYRNDLNKKEALRLPKWLFRLYNFCSG